MNQQANLSKKIDQLTEWLKTHPCKTKKEKTFQLNLLQTFKNKLEFEFDRTVSRLIEMQSTDYLASPHLA